MRNMNMNLYYIVSILFLVKSIYATQRFPTNMPFKDRINTMTTLRNGLILATAGAGLYAFKKGSIDGPLFTEDANLTGKDCVITGGNTGLGKETAIKLAALGANVIILCKSPDKAIAAAADISREASATNKNPKVSWMQLDLADLKSVEQVAQKLSQQLSKIDILVNNAGVMAVPTRQETKDGFEMHLGINHFGHYALTLSLMPLLRKADGDARVVTVSSEAHRLGSFKERKSEEEYMFKREGSYGAWEAYGNSKLANILFTKSLTQKLRSSANPDDQRIIPLVCHPGACRTELGRYIVDPEKLSLPAKAALGLVALPAVYFTKDAKMGAQTQIFLSASNSIRRTDAGKYFDNSKVSTPTDEANDQSTATWLWGESERLTGIRL